MPDMDGMELLEKIRASNAALLFILVTSQGWPCGRSCKVRITNYLRKPFDNGELFYTVERAADRAGLAVGNSTPR
jgi:DNA-binding NtrC family response regulator